MDLIKKEPIYVLWIFSGRHKQFTRPKILFFSSCESLKDALHKIASKENLDFTKLSKQAQKKIVDWMFKIRFIVFDSQFQKSIEIQQVNFEDNDELDLSIPLIESKYQMEESWPYENLFNEEHQIQKIIDQEFL